MRLPNSCHEVHDQPQHNTTDAERQAAMPDDQINRERHAATTDESGTRYIGQERNPLQIDDVTMLA